MSLTHATAVRNALADLIDSLVNTGAGTAVLEILDGATVLASFDLENPAFGAASSGTITLAGTTLSDASADNSGTADGFQVKDRDGTVIFSGTVTGSGGGGDVEADNTSITAGQSVDLTSFTYSASA